MSLSSPSPEPPRSGDEVDLGDDAAAAAAAAADGGGGGTTGPRLGARGGSGGGGGSVGCELEAAVEGEEEEGEKL